MLGGAVFEQLQPVDHLLPPNRASHRLARGLAAERNEGRDTADYLLSMDNLGDLLAEGVAAFGLSIEDIER